MGVTVTHYDATHANGEFSLASGVEFTECPPEEYLDSALSQPATKNGHPHYQVFVSQVTLTGFRLEINHCQIGNDGKLASERWALDFAASDPETADRDLMGFKIRLAWYLFSHPDMIGDMSARSLRDQMRQGMCELGVSPPIKPLHI